MEEVLEFMEPWKNFKRRCERSLEGVVGEVPRRMPCFHRDYHKRAPSPV